ncbi:hypothetical protein QFC21_006106 [Naganishia friedmannii]|uniref:Uncharacterized protein n=1 Tax=Naganishia friedmannii TaxID=89922 RepID=A0ACC2V590_9TREE|nr:hypothetical protein QFC21_006106 [Naganishia friedmannii]
MYEEDAGLVLEEETNNRESPSTRIHSHRHEWINTLLVSPLAMHPHKAPSRQVSTTQDKTLRELRNAYKSWVDEESKWNLRDLVQAENHIKTQSETIDQLYQDVKRYKSWAPTKQWRRWRLKEDIKTAQSIAAHNTASFTELQRLLFGSQGCGISDFGNSQTPPPPNHIEPSNLSVVSTGNSSSPTTVNPESQLSATSQTGGTTARSLGNHQSDGDEARTHI